MRQERTIRSSFTSLGFFGLVKRVVLCRRQNNEVFKSVIIWYTINMMNMLKTLKLTTQFFLHQEPVFSNPSCSDPNLNVSSPMLATRTNSPAVNSSFPSRVIFSFWLALGRTADGAKSLFAQVRLEHRLAECTRFFRQLFHGCFSLTLL